MKNILITGGNGYIGSNIAEYLYQSGYNISITKRKQEKYNYNFNTKFNIIYMDLLDENSISKVCKDINIVIHTASYDERMAPVKPKDALLANAYGTKLLLEDSVRENVEKFIYLSTFHVYGVSKGCITEESKVYPLTDYAISHYAAETYCNQYAKLKGVRTTVFRITNGFGVPNIENDKWYLVLNDICRMAMLNKEITLKTSGIQLRDFIAIKDIVKAIALLVLLDKDHDDLYNISSQKAISIRELAMIVANVYKLKYQESIKISIPEVNKQENLIDNNLFVSSQKLRNLGWNSTISIESEIYNIFDMLKMGAE